MSPRATPAKPRWYLVPARVLLVTFLLTLLSFAVSLFLGILGLLVTSRVRGVHPNLTLAYRNVALPVAVVVALISLISLTVLEIRNFRQTKTLAAIARASR